MLNPASLSCQRLYTGWLGGLAFAAALVCAAPAAELPRVFYLNSYHPGYGSSDQVMREIQDGLTNHAQLKVLFLDSKRLSPAEVEARAREAVSAIRQFEPRVLIASDDDAVKHVVVPQFRQGPLPVIFCGVNWSAEQYQLPTESVRGMIEVVPIRETLTLMQEYYPGAKRLIVLSEDSTSERSNRQSLDALYRKLGFDPEYVLVGDFVAWKAAFRRANSEGDLIYLPTNGAIRDWDKAAATEWVRQEIRKPVVTCDDFMMPYCVFGLTKVAGEQGEWAAQVTRKILEGQPVSSIPMATNSQTQAYFNAALAERIGFHPKPELRQKCLPVQAQNLRPN